MRVILALLVWLSVPCAAFAQRDPHETRQIATRCPGSVQEVITSAETKVWAISLTSTSTSSAVELGLYDASTAPASGNPRWELRAASSSANPTVTQTFDPPLPFDTGLTVDITSNAGFYCLSYEVGQ